MLLQHKGASYFNFLTHVHLGVSIRWIGPLDWTTGITFDPQNGTNGSSIQLSGFEDSVANPSAFTTVV
jgi:hypothetical protein